MRLVASLLILLCSCGSTVNDAGFDRPSDVPNWAGTTSEAPDRVTIYALNPMHVGSESGGDDVEAFHNYPVLGSVELTNANERAELIRLLYRTIHEDNGMRASCFNPRHGIRAQRGDQVADWVICFECLSMHVKDGKDAHVNLGTNPSIEPRFTQIYEAAGLKIDPN
tara:strand:+ start:1776 stop:2276 length:501 start_codon:yes stop_codon:yes gene_type:complete